MVVITTKPHINWGLSSLFLLKYVNKDFQLLPNTNKYQLAANVLFQKVDNETVILEPENGNYFTLDPVGTFMIENLQQDKTIEEVVNLINSTYDVASEQAESDLNELITNMLSQNLLIEQA